MNITIRRYMKKLLLLAMGLVISSAAYSTEITCETRESVTVKDYAMFLKPVVIDGFLLDATISDEEWVAIVTSIVSKYGKADPERRLQSIFRFECANTGKVNYEMHIKAFITVMENSEI